MVAVFSPVLCASEAIKLAKDFIFQAIAIRIGNRSYSISHRLFSFASINPGSTGLRAKMLDFFAGVPMADEDPPESWEVQPRELERIKVGRFHHC
jgi:hypothetical protein